MGFETFRVELHGPTATYREGEEAVRQYPHVAPDQQSLPMQGSTCYVIDDGRHVIEVELVESPLKLSCRFTLCHPPSVDAAFLGFIRAMMVRLGMAAKICDDVRPEHARFYSLNEFADFSTILARYIATRRTEWIAAFGDEVLAATTSEVHRRLILPRCQPGIKQPT